MRPARAAGRSGCESDMVSQRDPDTSPSGERVTGRGRLVRAVLSLQFKATVLVVALTLAVTAAVSGYLLRSSIRLAREQRHEQLVQLAGVLARGAATLITAGDWATLQTFAEDAADGSPLIYAIITDREGRELAAADYGSENILERQRRSIADRPVPGIPVYHWVPDSQVGSLDVSYPINERLEAETTPDAPSVRLIGYVHTGVAANGWHQSLSSKLDLVIGVGILATAVAIPLGFLLVRRIVTPLEGLAAAMRRFSRGRLEVRSPVRRRDEIGRLAVAFNLMADQHQQTHERIVRLNADLEDRVAQRTRQLRDLAARDPLTGLYNRRHFNDVLYRCFSEALRYDNDLSCIMVDLDDFKAVNDVFGHQVGDELLVLTATTITSQLRTADVPARFGGDEFIMLLPQTDVDRARVLSERIVERFADDLAASGRQVPTSMSMGIASIKSQQVQDADALVRAADRALYQAKAAGKNCIETAEMASVHPAG